MKFKVTFDLMELKVNKAPGPDDLDPYVLKACTNSLCKPLWRTIDSVISTSHILASDAEEGTH